MFTETLQKLEFKSGTWCDYKPHDTVEFIVCVALISTMFCFLDVSARHSAVIVNKRFYESSIVNEGFKTNSKFFQEEILN